jgi:hypothetical protein
MTKHLIIISLVMPLVSISTNTYSHELQQGVIEIGGDFGISAASNDVKTEGLEKMETETLNLSGNALYYIVPNFGVGLAWDYYSYEGKISNNKLESSSYKLGPTIAYNMSINEDTSIKLIGTLLDATRKRKSSSSSTNSDKGSGWSVGGQLSYFVNDFVSLNTTLRYTSTSMENNQYNYDTDTSGYNLGLGLSIYLK